MRAYSLICFALVLLVVTPVYGQQVVIKFTANVLTVGGTPFGIDPTLGTQVTGYFVYDTTTTDTNPDANRGDYPHSGGGTFSATVQGYSTVVTGSTTPWVRVENLSSDTFRFIDGPRTDDPVGGTMSVNGTPDANIELTIAITDTGWTVFDKKL